MFQFGIFGNRKRGYSYVGRAKSFRTKEQFIKAVNELVYGKNSKGEKFTVADVKTTFIKYSEDERNITTMSMCYTITNDKRCTQAYMVKSKKNPPANDKLSCEKWDEESWWSNT